MDEEDDDFYDPVDTVPTTQSQHPPQNATQDDNHMEDEEVEEEEDDVRAYFLHDWHIISNIVFRTTSTLLQKPPKAHQHPNREFPHCARSPPILIFLAPTLAIRAYDKNPQGQRPRTQLQ
jgi:hypothetical protein